MVQLDVEVIDVNGNLTPNATVTVYSDVIGYPVVISGTTDVSGIVSLLVDADVAYVVQASVGDSGSPPWFGSLPAVGGLLILNYQEHSSVFTPNATPAEETPNYLLIGTLVVGAGVLGYLVWKKFF